MTSLLRVALIVLVAGSLAGCTTPPSQYEQLMDRADRIAAQFPTPEAAAAAGYAPDAFCIPGMGVHWIHKPGQSDSYFDPTLDLEHPEVLLFQPADADMSDTTGDVLVGIEYVIVTEGLATNSTDALPSINGYRLVGPMPGHNPNMPWHAELHVYTADHARSTEAMEEVFASVTCPEGTTPPAP